MSRFAYNDVNHNILKSKYLQKYVFFLFLLPAEWDLNMTGHKGVKQGGGDYRYHLLFFFRKILLTFVAK
jgi:hypothetical protein